MKAVINTCYGGFSVSLAAARHMAAAGSQKAKAEVSEYEEEVADFKHYRKTGKCPAKREKFQKPMWDIHIKYGTLPDFHGYGYSEGSNGGYDRSDPLLVAAVEALGDKASGSHARLKVVEIPDGVEWEIDEYDGIEHIAEKHRTWA